MTFETQEEFIAFLRQQTVPNYAYSFLPGSKYPLQMTVTKTKDRLIMTEVA